MNPDPNQAMIRRLGAAVAVLLAVALGGILLLGPLHLRTETIPSSSPNRSGEPAAGPSSPAPPSKAESSDASASAPAPVLPREDFVAIPGGEFFAGCNEKVDQACMAEEKPGGPRSVEAFSIDRTEVTAADYQACVAAGACRETDRGDGCNVGRPGRERHPANCLDWAQARAYCAWRGVRLPTEWEWERAARGPDGRIHPWGDEPADCRRAVIDAGSGPSCGQGDTTAPVGSKPEGATTEGVLDLIGNVWEWTDSTREGTTSKVVRGGAYYVDPRQARASFGLPFKPSGRAPFAGFRCAR